MRLGLHSALAIVLLSVLYLAVGTLWLVTGGYASGHAFEPPEPYVTICRVLMLTGTLCLIPLFAAIHCFAPPDRKTQALAALAFIIVLTALTGADTVLLLGPFVRGLATAGVPHQPAPYPSMDFILQVELFAWGPVLASALLLAATVFRGDRLQNAIRASMLLAGSLCAINVLTLATGTTSLAVIAVVGYDFVLPLVCVLLAVLFSRQGAHRSQTA